MNTSENAEQEDGRGGGIIRPELGHHCSVVFHIFPNIRQYVWMQINAIHRRTEGGGRFLTPPPPLLTII